MRMQIIWLVVFLFVIAGCSGSNTARDPVVTGEDVKMKNKIATIDTDKGTIKFELYQDKAPVTAKNFIELASSGFYDGLTFHRYEPGFVIQGGDPNGDGTGGSGKNILLEINPALTHVKGAVAMARASDPNSASSQFYITLEDSHFLDGNYAVFGKVIEGMDVAGKLRDGDVMNKVTIS
ncbi:peptidylprolyl isomerase [Candidatus Woesearchaeota archaeon]|nr:peptidylprolyl isomerase [Candidatus Woesearchaeota archaeon]